MPPTDLLVLAGGFGTRLRAAVPDLPKPLALVAERPFLHYQLENWAGQGIGSFVFLLHHQADLITRFIESEVAGRTLGKCRVRTLIEPQPLGTGGAVAYAVRELGLTDSFLVANADTWLGGGVKAMSAAEVPSIAAVQVDDAGRYGALRVDGRGCIEAFEEKGKRSDTVWINAGLYHMRAADFSRWNGEPFSIENELFPRLVQTRQLRAVPLQTDFIDIGVPADYLRFCRWIESGKPSHL